MTMGLFTVKISVMVLPIHQCPYQPFYMFDWDGVLAVPTKDSFSIIQEAFHNIFSRLSGNNLTQYQKLDWSTIFGQTQGTTEGWLIDTVCREIGIPQNLIPEIRASFIHERARLIEDYNHNREVDFFDEGRIFTDATRLLDRIKATFPGAIFAIVSGNPTEVLRTRVPKKLRDFFQFWVGGEYGHYRHEMVNIAQKQAMDSGWKPYFDRMGRMVNAFYFDDSVHAVADVLYRGRAKVVWVVRPSEGENNLLKRGLNPINALEQNWPEENQKELNYLLEGRKNRGMPALYIPGNYSLYNTVLDNENFFLVSGGDAIYHGFLDPEAHAGFGVKPLDEQQGHGKERL